MFIFILIFFANTMVTRNPFLMTCGKHEVLAHGLKPKPFFLVIQKNKPIIFNINDKINDFFTVKDINKNSYSLVDSYGNEYIYSFA